ADVMPQQDENEGPAAALFMTDDHDAGDPGDFLANPQWPMELDAIARKHASRQRHRRKKAAAAGVAVWAKFGLASHRQKIEPMPQGRQRVARPREAITAVERRG